MLEIKSVRMEFPADATIILGQSHFIKTVEDLYEAVATAAPLAEFSLAFHESSGACGPRTGRWTYVRVGSFDCLSHRYSQRAHTVPKWEPQLEEVFPGVFS